MNKTKIIKMYLIMHKLNNKSMPVIPNIISRVIRLVFSCEIPPSCVLDEGVELMHGGLGIVIHKDAKIGANTKIYQNVTIGGKDGKSPIIGSNVMIGAGACILGGVTLGNYSKIGANAVVIHDVPPNATVTGIPASVIKK